MSGKHRFAVLACAVSAVALVAACEPVPAPHPTFTVRNLALPAGLILTTVAVGDVTGDGRADLVAAGAPENADGKGSLVVWSQGSDHRLQGPRQLPNTVPWHSEARLSIADVNGDGKQDAVLAASSGGIGVYLQRGSALSAATVLPMQAAEVRAVDMNGDRRTDLLTVDKPDSMVHLYLQQPNGTFDAGRAIGGQVSIGNGSGRVLAIGDPDGRLDVVGSLVDGFWISRQYPDHHFGPPKRYYTTVSSDGSRSGSFGIAVGDVNGDGIQDIVQTQNGTSYSSVVNVFTQTTRAAINAPKTLKAAPGPAAVIATDLNNDTLGDIAAVNRGIGVWTQGAGGKLDNEYVTPVTGYSYQTDSLAAGDLNGDGKPDLAFVRDDDDNLQLLYQK